MILNMREQALGGFLGDNEPSFILFDLLLQRCFVVLYWEMTDSTLSLAQQR